MANTRITETFEFLTDIITSYDGSEYRQKLRQYPRHHVSYDYDAMNKFEAQWLESFLRIRQSDAYYIPMWHNVSYLRENFTSGGKDLRIDPDYMYAFSQCKFIEVFKNDNIVHPTNIVREVQNYTSTNIIGLKFEIDEDLDMKNTFIYPMRRCALQLENNSNYVWANGFSTTLNFVDLCPHYAFDIPEDCRLYYEDYKGRNMFNLPERLEDKEVFINHPQWLENESLSLVVDKNVTRLDNDTGVFYYDLKNNKSTDVHTNDFYLMNKRAINNIIRFFYRVSGMHKSFFAPTWVNDFEPCNPIIAGTNYIYSEFNSQYKFYLNNSRTSEKHICVFTKDWRSYIFKIATFSYETINKKRYGKIFIMGNFPVSISLENIWLVSFVNLVRLDSDVLKLNYESNTVANTTLVMREVSG